MGLKRSLVNYILPKNYYLTRSLYAAAFTAKSWGKTPLLVYQMGKVGSSTIVATLKQLPLGLPVFHIHSLTRASIDADERFYFGANPSIFRGSGWPNTVHLFTSHYLQRQLQQLPANGMGTNRKWKVISLVREPVERNISGFFESIEYRIPNFYQRLERDELSLPEMTEQFIHRYENHDVPLRWFDDEMLQSLGVDVYATPFPHARGYQIYQSHKADLLLLRLESLSDCYQEAFRRFLGLEQFELVNANEAGDKAYYPTYRNFVKSVSLPNEYLSRMYESKYMRHFYTPAEIEQFRAKWQGRAVDQ